MLVMVGGAAAAKEIDLSTMSEPSGVYNIAFCTRPSPDAKDKPGHAFVAFSHQPPSGDRDFMAIGHTVGASVAPAAAIWSYWGNPVNGLLKEELYTDIKQACLDAKINKADYDKARQFTKPALDLMGLSAPGGTVFQGYKLGAEDCMGFMIDVANVLKPRGLVVPVRGATELPMDYMQRFVASN